MGAAAGLFCLVVAALSASAPTLSASADELDTIIEYVQTRDIAPPLPRSFFSRRAELRDIALSPNGKLVAYIFETGDAKQVRLYDLAKSTYQTLFTSRILRSIHWSTDGAHLFMETDQGIARVSLAARDRPSHVINLDRKIEEKFFGIDPTHPNAFLVARRIERDQPPVLTRVFADGQTEELYTPDTEVTDFLTVGEDRNFALQIRDKQLALLTLEGTTETTLLTCGVTDNCGLISYSATTDRLYMRGHFGDDLLGVYAINPHDGSHQLIHRDPGGTFDLNSVKIDKRTGMPALVGYRDDYTSFYGLNDAMKGAMAALEAQMQADYYHIIPDATLEHFVVIDQSTNEPERKVSFFSVAEQKLTAIPLASPATAAELNHRDNVAPRIPIWFTASDGMELQGYVTLPLGRDPASVPLVVVPHGGPWGRVDGSYDGRAQFLANRGYAVFEPNFRASMGFGLKYMTSGKREFGDGRVLQDILDGTNYILSRGIGRVGNMAIFGHSFGGFSVLSALSFAPDMYQVGIAGAPPADLAKAIDHYRKNRDDGDFSMSFEFYKDQAVNPDDPEDRRKMHMKSPDYHWEKINKPLYIWAGAQDLKVSVLDVRDYVLRLQHAGKAVTYLEEPRAGHSPKEPMAREAYFYMVEKALATHLGGPEPEPVNERLARHLKRVSRELR